MVEVMRIVVQRNVPFVSRLCGLKDREEQASRAVVVVVMLCTSVVIGSKIGYFRDRSALTHTAGRAFSGVTMQPYRSVARAAINVNSPTLDAQAIIVEGRQ